MTFAFPSVEGRNDERLLDAHVKSSHASTKVRGRYCSAEARCALIGSKTISLVVVVVRQPLKKEASTPNHLLVRVQPHDTSIIDVVNRRTLDSSFILIKNRI
jgi:hypothetical protein